MGDRAGYDQNYQPTLLAVSTVDGATPVTLEASPGSHALMVGDSLGKLVPYSYDYVAYTNTSTTVDTYTFKSGGAAGTLVATLTITYTDSTKATISTVART